MCCFLIATTGHTWTEIYDDWDFPRVNHWIEHCNQYPPLQAMVQSYLGIKPKKVLRLTEHNFEDFMRSISNGTMQ